MLDHDDTTLRNQLAYCEPEAIEPPETCGECRRYNMETGRCDKNPEQPVAKEEDDRCDDWVSYVTREKGMRQDLLGWLRSVDTKVTDSIKVLSEVRQDVRDHLKSHEALDEKLTDLADEVWGETGLKTFRIKTETEKESTRFSWGMVATWIALAVAVISAVGNMVLAFKHGP